MTAVAVHAWSVTLPFLVEDYAALGDLPGDLAVSAWSPVLAFFAPVQSEGQLFFQPMIGFHATKVALFGTDGEIKLSRCMCSR